MLWFYIFYAPLWSVATILTFLLPSGDVLAFPDWFLTGVTFMASPFVWLASLFGFQSLMIDVTTFVMSFLAIGFPVVIVVALARGIGKLRGASSPSVT